MIEMGTGEFTYRLVEGWGKLPEGWKFTQVAGISWIVRTMCMYSTEASIR